MDEIDDAFVFANEIIDINTVIDKYKFFREASIPKEQLIQNFNALILPQIIQESHTLFRKSTNNINHDPKQEFWVLKFLSKAEQNIYNGTGIKYSSFTNDNLREIAILSTKDNRVKEARNYLAKKGINLLFIDSLPGTKIDGAIYLTSYDTITIGLTGRFKRLDYIWFTLLHELSHIILHYNLLLTGIISIESSAEKLEITANRLAKESIITPEKYRVCIPKRTLKEGDLNKCARQNNIHPALLAGIIRKDLNNYSIFTSIINSEDLGRDISYE
jgi:HTH-type transcriptional regulator/antitoxin HigA